MPPAEDLLSRREFLKLSGLGLTGWLLRDLALPNRLAKQPSYGRVLPETLTAYDIPSTSGNPITEYAIDTILPFKGAIEGDELPAHNQTWYALQDGGYVHSTQVQPVEIIPQDPHKSPPAWGVLAEVTIHFTDAYTGPKKKGEPAYRYYYGSTHWVNKLVSDEDGLLWYRVRDDLVTGRTYYVQAAHLRVVPETELGPISSSVPFEDKLIVVRMAEQNLTAYERGVAVFHTRISTGDENGNPLWITPNGQFQTYYKRPSRHMTAGNRAFGDYDLPGVPWVCYITEYGIAFHGTYWHNDFGTPRSHGCINLSPQDAKWVYRWTQPVVPTDKQLKYEDFGTNVEII